MGTTYRSTLVNLLTESISMLDGSVNSSWALLSHSTLFTAQCHSAVFSHTQGCPDLWFQRLLQGISFPSRSCTCIVLMLLYLSENNFCCQSSKLFQCLLFFTECRGPVLLCSCCHLSAAFAQVIIHCKKLGLGAVAQLYPEVVLSLESGLVMAKWCCPLPQYGICITKVHFNKEVQETFY